MKAVLSDNTATLSGHSSVTHTNGVQMIDISTPTLREVYFPVLLHILEIAFSLQIQDIHNI